MKKSKSAIEFDVLTIFPKIFDSYLGESLFKRAIKNGLVKIGTINLRNFSDDKHQKVDDRPFGGGPGMVFKIEPIYKAVQFVLPVGTVGNVGIEQLKQAQRLNKRSDRTIRTRIILFSTRGKKLDNKSAKRLAAYDKLILICGRYEGVDERVAEHIADEEISIGDYVLSGGELPAMVLMESVSRFIPGFLGKEESLEDVRGSFPAYTRPEVFFPKKLKPKSLKPKAGWDVPKVLLSGNHKKINEWRARFGR